MIGAVVLAAGRSSRMGRPKATLTTSVGGPSFLDAILATLRAAGVVSSTAVVVAPGFEPEVPFVTNPDPGRGMLSSVQCGLRALSPGLEAVLLWPVDHPLVEPSTVVAMIAAFRSGGHAVVVPVFGGRRGHPVLFASRVVPELYRADPREGARAVVHTHADRLELPVGDPGVAWDIDTPDDYRRAFGYDGACSEETP